MKRRFSKILGVGLVLALLTSLLLTAAPVSAVTTPVVTLTAVDPTDAGVISKENTYTVLFTTGIKVPANGEIVVGFEAGHNITGMTGANVEIQTTAGLGGVEIDDDKEPPGPTAVHDAVVTGDYPAAQTLTITPSDSLIIGSGAIVELTIGGAGVFVTNPDTAGTYNLTVRTQKADDTVIEAAVTSADYTIKVPTIAGLPGVASVYNPVGILMAQENSLVTAMEKAGPDYTVYVGPGTYTGGTIDIIHEGLTFVSTAGAATTIIDASATAITINAAEVIVDGFTIEVEVGASSAGIQVFGANATVKNNIITAEPTEVGILIDGDGATVSDNVLDENCTIILTGISDCTLSGNTFGECVNLWPQDGRILEELTITDNIMIGSAAEAIDFINVTTGTFDDILIEGNTISEAAGPAAIYIRDVTAVTNLRILNNEITDNEGDGIHIDKWDSSNTIKFNTITGNDTSTGDYGIQNDATVDVENDVDATLNWWGTTVAADIALMVKATAPDGTVTYDPFLADTAEAVLSATKAGTGTSLDAKTAVGVKVSVANADTTTTVPTIAAAKYITNPQAAIAGAIAFFDVYVAGVTPVEEKVATATIKFYAGDANTEVYIWSADTETWGEVTPVAYSAYGGYVYVTVDVSYLGGTPFALVGGEAAAITAPTIISPDGGERDLPLTPTFSWTGIAAADGYYFQLADNANFVAPLVKLDGDLGRLIVTAYAQVSELDYSSAYYWRVKAVSGTEAAGNLAESSWSTAVFITMDEPVEPPPPIVVEEVQPPDIVIEETPPPIIKVEPIVEVVTPPATPITPVWIYIIIGVGAVLVIALIVLVVRTRRVA